MATWVGGDESSGWAGVFFEQPLAGWVWASRGVVMGTLGHFLALRFTLREACGWLPPFGWFAERDGYYGASGESWGLVSMRVSRDMDIAGPDLNWSAKNSVDCAASRHDTGFMNPTVASLKNAVEHLGRDDLAVFREWFTSFEAAEWDAQIERDISGGKLDKLAAEGIEDFVAGRTRSL